MIESLKSRFTAVDTDIVDPSPVGQPSTRIWTSGPSEAAASTTTAVRTDTAQTESSKPATRFSRSTASSSSSPAVLKPNLPKPPKAPTRAPTRFIVKASRTSAYHSDDDHKTATTAALRAKVDELSQTAERLRGERNDLEDNLDVTLKELETAQRQLRTAYNKIDSLNDKLFDSQNELGQVRKDLDAAQAGQAAMRLVNDLSESELNSSLDLTLDRLLLAVDTFIGDLEVLLPSFVERRMERPVDTRWNAAVGIDRAAVSLKVSVGEYLPPAMNQLVLYMAAEVWNCFVPGLSLDLDASLKQVYQALRRSMPSEWAQVSVWRQFTVRHVSTLKSDDPASGWSGLPSAGSDFAKATADYTVDLLDSILPSIGFDRWPEGSDPKDLEQFRAFETALVGGFEQLVELKLRSQTAAGILEAEVVFSSPPELPRGRAVRPDDPVYVQALGRNTSTYAKDPKDRTRNERPIKYGLARSVFSASFP